MLLDRIHHQRLRRQAGGRRVRRRVPEAERQFATTERPGCTRALQDVSHFGPSTVKLLAETSRKALTKAGVQLLVDGLDGAADAAGTPQAKQAIKPWQTPTTTTST